MYRQAALSRADTPEEDRTPHFLLMDECSWFISRSIGEMADQVRKFHLGIILATQRLGQLQPKDTREAVFAEVSNMISFQLGEDGEASYLARHLNTPELTASDIRHLGRYEIYAQLAPEGARLPAFWATTPTPPLGELNDLQIQQIIAHSRQRYAKPRPLVEEEIDARGNPIRNAEPEKRRRTGPSDHGAG
jgi:hypothetical protein